MQPNPLYLGIDLGTSGCRAIIINAQGDIVARHAVTMVEPLRDNKGISQAPEMWWDAVQCTLRGILADVDPQHIDTLAVDGTSGTVLLCDLAGLPIGPALMYNDARASNEAERIARLAPANSAAHGPSSGLAKLLWLQRARPTSEVAHALNQADWIIGRLSGNYRLSDTNNCLKLGYDPIAQSWPAWLHKVGVFTEWLPEVHEPGSYLTDIAPDIANEFGLRPDCQIIAGTTDSTAAIIATGAHEVGDAVTSLGSTLVMKVISERPIFSPKSGVYSQPLGRNWLVGGGSNSGGAVLRHFFSNQQLSELSARLQPIKPTGLHYYPLLSTGERFPVCDPDLAPILSPRPDDDAVFLQGLLEAMARIELQSYECLQKLGAPYPRTVRSAGGGANNPAWTAIRSGLLGIPLLPARQLDAAYGTALLALKGKTGRLLTEDAQ